MRKNRKFNPVQFSKNMVALEVLEQKLLMTVLSPSSNITPPSTIGWTIVESDTELNTSNISSDPGYNAIPSGFSTGANYTLRQIIGYYDYVYNSTQDWTVSLSANTTYTLSAYDAGSGASRGENNNSYGDLDVFAGAYSGMGHLILSAPAGSPATITCDQLNDGINLDRIFNIMSGGSLILNNVIITGGLAKDNGSYPNTDAFGGGILVESGGSLSLKSSTITQNYAIGSNGPDVIGSNSNTRQAAGYNAAGGGIYGTAGSTITIDSASVVSYNNIRGGKGGNVSNLTMNNGAGGAGGNAYGAGIAINAPASGSVQTTSTYPTNLYLDGGAVIANNQINNVTTQTNGTKIYGGTGGSCFGGKGGSGGNAYGAGLFMSSGALNMDGGSLKTAVNISNNILNYGRGYTSNTTSSANVGANGLADGAGSYLAPGLVTVANAPSSSPVNISVPNYGFETPVQGTGGFTQGQTGASWAFVGSSGISNNGSGFTGSNPDAPQGNQVAFLQGSSSFSQTISGFESGTFYDMTFYAAQRAGYPQDSISVQIDGVSLGTFIPENTNYQLFMINGFNPGSGSHTLTFTGLNPNNTDETVFVDDIVITSETGILQFSNNSINNTLSSIYFPTVETGDIGYTSADGPWTLRTAVAALNPLVATGMNLSLDLPAGNISLVNSISGSNTGSISVANTGTGTLTIVGASESGSIISNSNLTTSIFNLSSADVTFSNLTITGSNTTGNGGAITQSGGSSTLNDVTLSYNKSGNGGAFYSDGGSFTMIGGSVIGNSAPSGGGGGFFFNGGMAATLSDVNVSQNTAATSGGYGGGLMQDAGGSLTVKNNTVIQNNSAASGAGLYVTGTVVFSGGKISKNTASSIGGGMVISTGGSVNLTNVSVVSNQVASASTPVGFGGGIYQGNASLNLLGSTVIKNNSAGNSGGIYAGNSKLVASGTKFSGNSSSGNGGGLGITNGGSADLSGVTFSGNAANNGLGGGIYQNGGSVNIKNGSKFKSNSASQGGAAYSTNGTTSMNGGIVQNNKAVYYGGGLLSYNNNLNVTDVSVITNALTSGGSPSGSGGGLSQTGSGTLNLKNSVVKNNSAEQGGGLFFYTSTLNVSGSSFKSNTATSVGAGIYASDNTKAMNFTSVNISSNTISGSGASSGAGIYVAGGTLNTNGFNLKYNKITAASNSTIQGAGIYATGTTINFNGAVSVASNALTSNGTATGAGLYLTNSATLNQNNSLAINNNTITCMSGSNAGNGVGAGVAFASGTAFNSSGSLSFGGNFASGGGNDIAFQVGYTSDNNNSASSINDFTSSSSTGSLRSAINFAQNWMNGGGSNPTSMAILLSSNSFYELSQAYWQLTTYVPSSCELTIIGAGSSQSTITTDGGGERVFNILGSGTLVLQNLIVTGGNAVNQANGGGIYLNSGTTLTLNNVSVTGNKAGYTGTAAAGGNSSGTASGHAANGGNGSNGASGYGGGIYMAGGTLNLLSNSSVTGNYVYGQNGGNGGNGKNGSVTFSQNGGLCAVHDTNRINGGNGGYGGVGGSAWGGGIYQAAGTLNSPSGSANINGNTADPGRGGYSGAGGAAGSYSKSVCSHTYTRTSLAGSSPTPNPYVSGSSNANYDHAGGQSVFSSNSTANAQSIGGLYQSAGSINQAALPSAGVPIPLPGVVLELYSDDDKLIATATTDQNGRYRFNTDYSGIGYVHLVSLKTFEVSEKGSHFSGGVTSAFDPASGKTDRVQLLNGVVVNTKLHLVLTKIESSLMVKGNSISLNRTGTHSALWQTQLMPKSYHGGFTLSTFDVNKDTTSDYVLITKTGKPMAFIVDARTGRSTKLSGQVASNLRSGFVVQTANVVGDYTPELILAPSRDRSGRISVIDLQAQKVLWNATDFVLGGMKINVVGTQSGAGPEMSDLQLVSIRQVNNHKVLDGTTGRVVETVSERLRLQEIRKAKRQEYLLTAKSGEAAEHKEIHSSSVQSAQVKTNAKVRIPMKKLPLMV